MFTVTLADTQTPYRCHYTWHSDAK